MNPSKESGLKLNSGKPRAYLPDELESEIEAYFKWCLAHYEESASAGKIVRLQKPLVPSVGSLCNYLDICRDTLHNYEQQDEYSDIVKTTKAKIKEAIESALINGQGSTTGLIFYLKAKEGWVDKQTVQHEGEITVTLNLD